MLDVRFERPPRAVVGDLRNAGICADPDSWARLSGGRTNRLWTFRENDRTLVCKLFDNTGATPLFPNDAKAEALALTALAGTDLAPRLRDLLTSAGSDVLVYDYVEAVGRQDATDIAKALRRLHDCAPPPGLRSLDAAPETILARADAMLRGIADPRAHALRGLRPAPNRCDPSETVFLHGDPVPANAVAGQTGLCLIDWQCPAIGDPTHDLAVFLSPAMQRLYGGYTLGDAQTSAFLDAYGHAGRAARYRQMAPFYHWRMAAYCLWKTNAGDTAYSHAADLEIARLKRFGFD